MLTYYKLIDIEHYDSIIEKCLSYVKSIDRIYYRKLPKTTWYKLNLTELKKACPELEEAFLKYDLNIVMAAAYVMYQTDHSIIHADGWWSTARINIPLLNCKNTYTNFYKSDMEIMKWISRTGLAAYIPRKDSTTSLVDKVEITQTTVLRTKELHTVYMPEGSPGPRITLTLGFDKDPVYLLDEFSK
jgi:nitrogen fixation protein